MKTSAILHKLNHIDALLIGAENIVREGAPDGSGQWAAQFLIQDGRRRLAEIYARLDADSVAKAQRRIQREAAQAAHGGAGEAA